MAPNVHTFKRRWPAQPYTVAMAILSRRSRHGRSLLMTTRFYKEVAVSLQVLRVTLFSHGIKVLFPVNGFMIHWSAARTHCQSRLIHCQHVRKRLQVFLLPRHCPCSLPSASSATTSIRLARSSALTVARRSRSNGAADAMRSMIRPLRIAPSAARNFQCYLLGLRRHQCRRPRTLRPPRPHSASGCHSVSISISMSLPSLRHPLQR